MPRTRTTRFLDVLLTRCRCCGGLGGTGWSRALPLRFPSWPPSPSCACCRAAITCRPSSSRPAWGTEPPTAGAYAPVHRRAHLAAIIREVGLIDQAHAAELKPRLSEEDL